jgi:rare lipoprotein A
MAGSAHAHLRRATSLAVLAVCAGFLGACAAQPAKPTVSAKKQSKEYFAESVYGVKASPRVTSKKSNLPRGGGRDQLGKPYKVRGKMYYPKEEKSYKATGLASWYGDAFHGRLTANGEIYDMTHLTGAHPTMPLPSYARVTNVGNGSSVIVRINDRGPYHEGRVVDLSHKAADMLGFAGAGTAKVKVEYVGRAPLDGEDDAYLLASYKPGNAAPDPSDGLPTGVMIAMNGPTPSQSTGAVVPMPSFPGTLRDVAPQPQTTILQAGFVDLPAFGPIVPERPAAADLAPMVLAAMSYAPQERSAAARAVDVFAAGPQVGAAPATQPAEAAASPFIAAGTFADAAAARALADGLAQFGKVEIETSTEEGASLFSVTLRSDGRQSIDALLKAAWDHGAPDAIMVRD